MSNRSKTPKTIKREATEQDLLDNPELVEQGVKVGDEIEIPAEPGESKAGSKKKDDPELKKKMAPYLKTYPDEGRRRRGV